MTPFFLTQFLEFLQFEKRYSLHTLTAYEKDIDQFITFSSITKNEDFLEINYQVIRSWMVDLVDSGCSNRTISRKLSSLRSMYSWLQKKNHVVDNPLTKIKAPKLSKRLPSFAKEKDLSKDQLNILFDLSFEGVRNKLIIEILYQTGIRLSELVNLKESDIHSNQIKVIGKRNKERIIPIALELKTIIVSFIQLKQELGLSGDYLLVLKNGDKIYSKLVYRLINSYLVNVTDLDKCSPHVLRHTFATHMLDNGAGLETLKELLGHASLSATQVYTHNTFSQLTNIYSQTHPRGGKNK